MSEAHSRILVTGSNGQLGSSIKKLSAEYAKYEFIFVEREELDLSDESSIRTFLSENRFDVIINCAAYTAVDQAESDAEMADALNHLAVKVLAEETKKQNAFLVHVSTDYVFDGKGFKPYSENHRTSPQSVYGQTKLDGEHAFQGVNPRGCIIRTSWVYSEFGNNFVKTMLRLGGERDTLGVIFDQVGTPTYATDLAKTILGIISANDNGIELSGLNGSPIYHFSNEGVCSWYDFAKSIFEMSDVDCLVNPIETKEYPTPATRPHYSVMNKHKIKQALGITIPYWKDSLKQCINQLQERS